jgi:DNA-binding CsgD family transcriptional regulator
MTATARRSAPLGRTSEFDRATADHRSGAGVMIVGARGCGRTSFASAVADHAERNGRAPLWVTASATLQSIRFGAFASMVEPDADATAVQRIGSVVTALRFHAGSAPTTLIVDDIHLLDDASADVVLQAVSTRAVALIATAVTGTHLTGAVRQLVDDQFLDVLELQPFDRDAVERIACGLLNGPPAPSTAELLWRWSDGLPGPLNDIVRIGRDESRFRLVNGYWWWDGPAPLLLGVPAHVQRQIDQLSDAALDAFDLIVLGDQIDADIVERMVSEQSLVELERADLIASVQRHDGVSVRCSRTHMAQHRRSLMPALRRRSLARRLLDELPPPSTPAEITRSASLQSYAGHPSDALMVEHATSILRLTDPHSAHSLAEARHQASPTVTTAVDLIDSCVEIGDAIGANRVLAEAWSLSNGAGDTRRLTEAAFAVALFAGRNPVHARRLVDEQRRTDGTNGSEVALSRSLDALALLLSARPDEAEALAREALAAETLEASRLRAGVTVVAALLMRGQTDAAHTLAGALLDEAVRLTAVMPSALGMLRAEIAFIHLWQGELTTVPGAHPLTGRWPVPPLAHDPIDHQIDWALMAGIVSHLRGDHANAVSQLNEAVVQQAQGKGIFHAEASAWLIVALCDGGRTTEAVRALHQFPNRHLAILPGLHEWAGGVVASARGRVTEAAELLSAAANEARAVGAYLIEARYLIELADRCSDDSSIARIDELSHLVDAPLLTTLCCGAVARLKGDSMAMLASAAVLDELGLPSKAKAMARDAEAAAVGAGEATVARDARRARRSMRGQPAATSSNVAGLSPRELEVAGLAAGGMADREIAARLVLSVRTIESHLASAYRKLAVSSRGELAPALH